MRSQIAVIVSLCLTTVAAADFEGDYSPGAWTFFDQADGSGSLDETEMIVVGGNNGLAGITEYYIVVPQDALLSFDAWFVNYDQAGFDRSYFSVNGQRTIIATNSGGPVPLAVGVAAGDRFALGVETDDGTFGQGELTVRNLFAGQLGDLNCDNAVNLGDVPAFVLALVDPVGYAQDYSWCDINWGDMNGDTLIDAADLPPFVALILGP